MSTRALRIALIFVALCMMTVCAANALTADIVMKTSKTAQDSIVNEGEDLAIVVELDGADVSTYRWFFNDELIPGADYATLDIISATVDDAGKYRFEAFNDEGAMVVSMEFNVRVIEKELPKSGDSAVSKSVLFAAMALLTVIGGYAFYRKRRAA